MAACSGGGLPVLVGNTSSCACPVGEFFYGAACSPFTVKNGRGESVAQESTSGFSFPFSGSSFNARSTTQSIFLITTVSLIVAWLLFAFGLRLFPLEGPFFRLRYWISRNDRRFSKRHWLDEQKCQVKRRTELGGVITNASYIFLFGLIAGLLVEAFTKSRVEVQTVQPINGRDILSFSSDVNLTVTTISNMTCRQLAERGSLTADSLDRLASTRPAMASTSVSCRDSALGPTVELLCPACVFVHDDYFLTLAFADAPDSPAVAVGFSFAMTLRREGRTSQVSGRVVASASQQAPGGATLRGPETSVISVSLLPRRFTYKNDLNLLQVTYKSFERGSYVADNAALKAALAEPQRVAVTVHMNILSSYIVQTSIEQTNGFLTVASSIGGIYNISISLFFFILMQLEVHFRWLAYDDKLLNKKQAQRMARQRWDKLRLYVRYFGVGQSGGFLSKADGGNPTIAPPGRDPPHPGSSLRRAPPGSFRANGSEEVGGSKRRSFRAINDEKRVPLREWLAVNRMERLLQKLSWRSPEAATSAGLLREGIPASGEATDSDTRVAQPTSR